MELHSPSNTSTPPQYPQPPAPDTTHQPKKRWPFSRKVTVMIGAAIVIVLLVVVALVANKSSSSDKGASQDKSSLYIKQPGYENNNAGIGDALALISKPEGPVAQYGGGNVIQACSVVTIKDVRDAGLKISANQLTGSVRRVFFDGLSSAQLKKPSDLFLPFNDDSNFCQYYLEGKGSVEVTVYQPTYASKSAMDYELGKGYTLAPSINDLKVYQKKPGEKPDAATYVVRGDNFDAKLDITTPNAEAKANILNVLAKRLGEGAGGTAIQLFSYQSPIFTGDTVNPCFLLDNPDDFKKILGVDSSPLIEESLATAVGVIEDSTTKKLYNYVSHDCKRRSPEGSTKDRTLLLDTQTYESEDGAKALLAFERSSGSLTKNLQEVSPVIGDESFFADTSGMDNALVFRKGRVVIHMSFYLPQNNDAVPAEKRIEALRPLAEAIASDRLKSF
jgi:hypothetical protein